MRIREPKTTALIFASGKMVVTGAKSEDDSKLASRKYARIIQKLGFNAKFTDFKIQNIVGSCDIKFPIRLEGLASRHHNFSSYEPELFPGLIYRMIKPKIVLLIFVSGKIVLTGAKVREEIYQAFEMIYPVLQGTFFFSAIGMPRSKFANICLQTSAKSRYTHGMVSTRRELLISAPTTTCISISFLRFHDANFAPRLGYARAILAVLRYPCLYHSNLFLLHCIGVWGGRKGGESFSAMDLVHKKKDYFLPRQTK